MKNETIITSIFNTKTIIQAGGIVVALLSIWTLYKVLTNDLPHIQRAIDNQTSTLNEVLRDNTKAIEGNTEVIRSLQIKIK